MSAITILLEEMANGSASIGQMQAFQRVLHNAKWHPSSIKQTAINQGDPKLAGISEPNVYKNVYVTDSHRTYLHAQAIPILPTVNHLYFVQTFCRTIMHWPASTFTFMTAPDPDISLVDYTAYLTNLKYTQFADLLVLYLKYATVEHYDELTAMNYAIREFQENEFIVPAIPSAIDMSISESIYIGPEIQDWHVVFLCGFVAYREMV